MVYIYDFDDGEFEYEPEYKEIEDAIIEILVSECKNKTSGARKMAEYVVYNLDVLDALEEQYQDYLLYCFENKAYRQYKEQVEFQKDKDDWFGTKRDILG